MGSLQRYKLDPLDALKDLFSQLKLSHQLIISTLSLCLICSFIYFYILYFRSSLFASIPLLTFPTHTTSKFSLLTQKDPWIKLKQLVRLLVFFSSPLSLMQASAPAGRMAQVLLKLFQPC